MSQPEFLFGNDRRIIPVNHLSYIDPLSKKCMSHPPADMRSDIILINNQSAVQIRRCRKCDHSRLIGNWTHQFEPIYLHNPTWTGPFVWIKKSGIQCLKALQSDWQHILHIVIEFCNISRRLESVNNTDFRCVSFKNYYHYQIVQFY